MKQRVITRPEMPLAPLHIQRRRDADPASPANSPQANLGEEQLPSIIDSHPDIIEDVLSIPVSKLRVSPYNARKIRVPKRIARVAESLKAHGQKDPLYVYPGNGDDTGYYLVLGGETRRLAALQIALPSLKAIVDYRLNPDDALTLTRISSILNDSADECDLDRAMVVAGLLDKGHTQTEAAEVLGLESHTHIQRLNKLATLPRRFIDFGQDYPERFSASFGAYISQAIEKHGEDFGYTLMQTAILENISHRKLMRMIEDGPRGKQTISENTHRLRRDGGFDISLPDAPGGRYDIYKSKNLGMKVLKMQLEVPENLANELNQKLTKVLVDFMSASKPE